MTVRVAINGFGRIGRLVLRSIVEHGRRDIEVVAINDLGPVETNAHLLRYDSVHGRFPGTVESGEDWIDVGTGKIKVTAERDPAKLPHKELNVDIAFECTGIFTSKEKASAHLKAGAKRVLVSAPGDNADKTIVYKVNHETLTADDIVVSNGSCTTNALAPVAKVLHDLFGIERGYMTTIHAYTGDQPTLDTMHKDLYRGRAAALSMIPTSTGAAKALGLVLPELKGKLDGSSIRVPTPNVSVVDLKVVAGREVTVEEINAAMQAAADGPMKGVLATTDRAAGLDRPEPHRRLLHRRPAPDPGRRRQAGPRPDLVRQRVGLRDAHGRHGAGDEQADLRQRCARPFSPRGRGLSPAKRIGSRGRVGAILWKRRSPAPARLADKGPALRRMLPDGVQHEVRISKHGPFPNLRIVNPGRLRSVDRCAAIAIFAQPMHEAVQLDHQIEPETAEVRDPRTDAVLASKLPVSNRGSASAANGRLCHAH